METVEMTADERREFEAFKAAKEKKEAEAKRKADREAYTALVDETIAAVMPELTNISELFGVKDDQQSHTFTNSESTMRITIGHYILDNYRDTVNEGIAMVKTYIESQARDDASRALVKAILRLLSRDEAGNLKASRVLQLQKMAEETGDERFIEGVRIIQESYQPTPSKDYIRAAVRDESGAWVAIPLSMTDV